MTNYYKCPECSKETYWAKIDKPGMTGTLYTDILYLADKFIGYKLCKHHENYGDARDLLRKCWGHVPSDLRKEIEEKGFLK